MKKIVLLYFLIVSFSAFSQQTTIEVEQNDAVLQNSDVVYSSNAVDIQPVFPGGTNAFFKFVGMNFRYPEDPEFTGGKMMVLFVVEKDGSLSDIKAVKSLGFGAEQEIVRVLKMSPRWNAAMINGEKVRASYTIPITLHSGK